MVQAAKDDSFSAATENKASKMVENGTHTLVVTVVCRPNDEAVSAAKRWVEHRRVAQKTA